MHERDETERGSALVMVLVVIVFVAVVTTSALAYSFTSIKSANDSLIPARTSLYDADGAMQTAIQYVKTYPVSGADLVPCPSDTVTYPGAGAPVSVEICPEPDSLIPGSGYRAVMLALGQTPEGILLGHDGNLDVDGSVFSNGVLNLAGSGTCPAPTGPSCLNITRGKAWAWDACTRPANVTITNPASTVVCDAKNTFPTTTLTDGILESDLVLPVASTSELPIADPFVPFVVRIGKEKVRVDGVGAGRAGMRAGVATVSHRACDGRGYDHTTAATHADNAKVVLVPKVAIDPGDPIFGRENDWKRAGDPLSIVQPVIQAACPPGPGTSAILYPGVYYDPSTATGISRVTTTCATTTLKPGMYFLDFPQSTVGWEIDKTVIAECEASGQGVQIVFGDKSTIDLSGILNIPCGRSAGSGPKIALYGLQDEVFPPAALVETVLRPSVATDTGTAPGGEFTATAANALPSAAPTYPQDGTQAAAAIVNGDTAKLELSNFVVASGPVLPANADIESLTVTVAHDEAAGQTLARDETRLGNVRTRDCCPRIDGGDDMDLRRCENGPRWLRGRQSIDDEVDVAGTCDLGCRTHLSGRRRRRRGPHHMERPGAPCVEGLPRGRSWLPDTGSPRRRAVRRRRCVSANRKDQGRSREQRRDEADESPHRSRHRHRCAAAALLELPGHRRRHRPAAPRRSRLEGIDWRRAVDGGLRHVHHRPGSEDQLMD